MASFLNPFQVARSRATSRTLSPGNASRKASSMPMSRKGSKNQLRRSNSLRRLVRLKEEDTQPPPDNGAKTLVVGAVWSKYWSINEAVNDACDGDIIALHPGEYEERLTLNRKGITVVGTGDREAVKLMNGVICTADIVLRNVVVHKGISIESGSPVITDCHITSAKHGITILASSQPVIRKNTITNCEVSGVYVFPRGGGVVERCNMTSQGKPQSVGVFVDDGATLIKNNTIAHFDVGVYLRNEALKCTVKGNQLQNIGSTAVVCTGGTKSRVESNTIAPTKYYGILIEAASSPTIKQNTVQASPVCIRKGCKPNLIGNDMTGRVLREEEATC